LTSSKVVALHISCCSSEILGAVSGGSPCCCARDLSEEDVECLGSGGTTVGECNSSSVGRSCSELSIHVVVSVCSADRWRIFSGLSCNSQVVCASTSSGGGSEAREGLEVKPELADVILDLVDGVGAGARGGGGVRAWVIWVPDVGGVGGDAGSTGGGVDHTADTKPCSTVSIGRSSFRGALGGGVAGAVSGGGAGGGAHLIRELHNGKQREGSSCLGAVV